MKQIMIELLTYYLAIHLHVHFQAMLWLDLFHNTLAYNLEHTKLKQLKERLILPFFERFIRQFLYAMKVGNSYHFQGFLSFLNSYPKNE